MTFYWGETDERFERRQRRLRRQVARQICRIYGVPPWVAGVGRVPLHVRLGDLWRRLREGKQA